MVNKVNNQKADVLAKSSILNDEDILQDVLASMKHLSTVYGTFVQEASNKQLLAKIEPIAKEVGTLARNSFNLMFEKGWYTLEVAVPKNIDKEYQKFLKKGQSL